MWKKRIGLVIIVLFCVSLFQNFGFLDSGVSYICDESGKLSLHGGQKYNYELILPNGIVDLVSTGAYSVENNIIRFQVEDPQKHIDIPNGVFSNDEGRLKLEDVNCIIN